MKIEFITQNIEDETELQYAFYQIYGAVKKELGNKVCAFQGDHLFVGDKGVDSCTYNLDLGKFRAGDIGWRILSKEIADKFFKSKVDPRKISKLVKPFVPSKLNLVEKEQEVESKAEEKSSGDGFFSKFL
jgi:hypothetical protein